MSRVYYTSDWHIGHKNIANYRNEFASIEEHDKTIIDNYNETIRPRDIVYFLGDICFDKASLDVIRALPGRKRLVMGNHENQYGEFRTSELWDVFEKIYGLHTRKKVWMSHAPIHPEELRDKPNVHGHVHKNTIQDYRYANVCLENCNYYPVDFEGIKAAFAAKRIFTKLKDLPMNTITLEDLDENIHDMEPVYEAISKDASLPDFDLENFGCTPNDEDDYLNAGELLGLRKSATGVSYIGINAGGDWEIPLYFIMYKEDGELKAYVPSNGNTYNKRFHTAYGSEMETEEFYKLPEEEQQVIEDADHNDLAIDKEDLLADIEAFFAAK